jgi:hypothetical protein
MNEQSTRRLYLDLLEKAVTNLLYGDSPIPNPWLPETEFDSGRRENGQDWPSQAHTMVGLKRIQNVRFCLEQVIADGVPGDFIETGVWRGGVCIFARAVLAAHDVTGRQIWVADSFEGIPDPGENGHAMDKEMALHQANDVLGVTMDTVKENFERYGLLDDQVRFLPGWFKDSLPTAPIDKLAVIRLDGDLYESTIDALKNLYHRLSPGGFVIIDDYCIPACRQAVEDFRSTEGIADPIEKIDDYSVFWRRADLSIVTGVGK